MASSPNEIRPSGQIPELDSVDWKILGLLQDNARLANKSIAQLIGLSPSTTSERVRRLRECGVIKGFQANIDPAMIGRPTQAMIAIRLDHHRRDEIDRFHEHLLGLPESLAVYHVTGSDDYLVHVAVPTSEHLRQLVLDQLTARPEVDHVETRLIYEEKRLAIEPIRRDPAQP